MKNIVMKMMGVSERRAKREPEAETAADDRRDNSFVWGAIFLTILIGLLIPSAVIAASPEEFINLEYFMNPLFYVFNTFCIAAGFF
ncbi:MAG: hypothetical protein IJ075_04070, partial [Lachnospiraceae bacterium]|nr:hypothetical protein [Lachnospiraceae bacterium]